MNELEALWERLRIMNRSLEEDKRINHQLYMESKSDILDEVLLEECISISARQETVNEIMEIVEGMMDSEEGRPS